jgi:hypothetical protein
MDMFWGDRCGVVADADGNNWMIATHIAELTAEEMKKKMKEQTSGQASAAAAQGTGPLKWNTRGSYTFSLPRFLSLKIRGSGTDLAAIVEGLRWMNHGKTAHLRLGGSEAFGIRHL